MNTESHPDVQLDNRHMMIRGENTAKVIEIFAYGCSSVDFYLLL